MILVTGNMERSLADFERACLTHIEEEQAKPNPDNATIALLCDAVRLARENAEMFSRLVVDNILRDL